MVTKKVQKTGVTSAVHQESYKDVRAELDAVLDRLQDATGDVDDAVALYGQAMKLSVKLEAHLDKAENRIKKIQADFGASAELS